MLGKRSRLPTIGKLAEAIRSSGIVDSITSPRSPLDCTMQSPRGLKNYDQQGGVGLGIVVALDNNTNKSGGEILAKYALNTRFSFSSRPIPMNKSSGTGNNNELEAHGNMLDEEFTYVTSYGPKKSTKVYCNGVEYGHVVGRSINQNFGVFKISSPARLFDDRCNSSDNDFLSSCHLCRKTLHGKDIYMYRGEKAFCSTECREKQISIDERKEKCGSSEAYVSSSPCSYASRKGQMFSNGIMAA